MCVTYSMNGFFIFLHIVCLSFTLRSTGLRTACARGADFLRFSSHSDLRRRIHKRLYESTNQWTISGGESIGAAGVHARKQTRFRDASLLTSQTIAVQTNVFNTLNGGVSTIMRRTIDHPVTTANVHYSRYYTRANDGFVYLL